MWDICPTAQSPSVGVESKRSQRQSQKSTDTVSLQEGEQSGSAARGQRMPRPRAISLGNTKQAENIGTDSAESAGDSVVFELENRKAGAENGPS